MLVCVFSFHRESPNLILVDEPLILRWFCHNWADQATFDRWLGLVPWPIQPFQPAVRGRLPCPMGCRPGPDSNPLLFTTFPFSKFIICLNILEIHLNF
jgi:hypothetical protein